MIKGEVQNKYRSFIAEISADLKGKKIGYCKTLKIGKKIFPYSIPPQLEIILLDPEEQNICYRMASDPESHRPRKGDWQVGRPVDAVSCAIDWADSMKKIKLQCAA